MGRRTYDTRKFLDYVNHEILLYSCVDLHVPLMSNFAAIDLRRGASMLGSSFASTVCFPIRAERFANLTRFSSPRTDDSPASSAPRFRFNWIPSAERVFSGLILLGVVTGLDGMAYDEAGVPGVASPAPGSGSFVSCGEDKMLTPRLIEPGLGDSVEDASGVARPEVFAYGVCGSCLFDKVTRLIDCLCAVDPVEFFVDVAGALDRPLPLCISSRSGSVGVEDNLVLFVCGSDSLP